MRRLLLIAQVLLASLACTFGAYAQTATQSVTQNAVDMTPLINFAIQAIAVVLMMIGIPVLIYIINWFRNKAGLSAIQLTQAQQEQMEVVWRKMIGYGIQTTSNVTAQAAAAGDFVVTPNSEFLSNVLKYGLEHYRDTMQKAGVMRSDGSIDPEKLVNIMNTRLGLMAVSSSVGQPAAVATAPDVSKGATSGPTNV